MTTALSMRVRGATADAAYDADDMLTQYGQFFILAYGVTWLGAIP
jgi:hypothetical protein